MRECVASSSRRVASCEESCRDSVFGACEKFGSLIRAAIGVAESVDGFRQFRTFVQWIDNAVVISVEFRAAVGVAEVVHGFRRAGTFVEWIEIGRAHV